MSRISRLLNTSVEVWRATRTPDGGGGYEEAWVLVDTIRARISQPTARERLIADQAQAKLDTVVYAPDGADIRRNDELRQPSRSFQVLATFQPSVPGTYLRADCYVIQPS